MVGVEECWPVCGLLVLFSEKTEGAWRKGREKVGVEEGKG